MMTVINVGGPLRDVFEGEPVLRLAGERSLGLVIEDLDRRYAGAHSVLVRRGMLSRFVTASIDGTSVRALGGLAAFVPESSTVELTFAVSGG